MSGPEAGEARIHTPGVCEVTGVERGWLLRRLSGRQLSRSIMPLSSGQSLGDESARPLVFFICQEGRRLSTQEPLSLTDSLPSFLPERITPHPVASFVTDLDLCIGLFIYLFQSVRKRGSKQQKICGSLR